MELPQFPWIIAIGVGSKRPRVDRRAGYAHFRRVRTRGTVESVRIVAWVIPSCVSVACSAPQELPGKEAPGSAQVRGRAAFSSGVGAVLPKGSPHAAEPSPVAVAAGRGWCTDRGRTEASRSRLGLLLLLR